MDAEDSASYMADPTVGTEEIVCTATSSTQAHVALDHK